ncbi:hypothetical protein GCM10018980_03680 [Streptomyces capoamus]|uniref:Uncharacterized protein n=1 Tax=Streptomyces capoamus TaxID=68183 RepID=A0A919BYU5_9ACTN|nr:hypothetical protein [Streptomyces capoamus]GGW12291.1 hypothetical protein GCM10010501_11680 [Streptomyces libani subsp. rufus]GHG34297.1 hypothetical protein GCM10018980_03680 [Streptomyces capoamus]
MTTHQHRPDPEPDGYGDEADSLEPRQSRNGRPDADRAWQSLALDGKPGSGGPEPQLPPLPGLDPLPAGAADSHTVSDRVMPPTAIPQMSGAAPAGVRIGVWGASGSGKTTFLGAVPIGAIQHRQRARVNWVVAGMDASSQEFLLDSVDQLVSQHRFPEATRAQRDLRWSFTGDAQGTAGLRRRRISFALEVLDLPGEAFNPRSNQVAEDLHEQAVTHLSNCDGLVYLFDPLLDANEQTASINYFYGMATQMAARVRDENRLLRNGRLPHHVAVCITKFDHPDVFEPALRARWVYQEQPGAIPCVLDHQARGFFDWICNSFRGGSARLVRDALGNFFHPDRMSFYATSAIGFRLNANHQFDYRSYVNVEPDGERICSSPPTPINVIEPLMALEERLRGSSRGGGKLWRGRG